MCSKLCCKAAKICRLPLGATRYVMTFVFNSGGSQVCYDFLYLKVEASRYVMVFVSKIGCTQVCYDFCILMWGQPVMFVSKLLPWIYALFGIKFPGLRIRWKKMSHESKPNLCGSSRLIQIRLVFTFPEKSRQLSKDSMVGILQVDISDIYLSTDKYKIHGRAICILHVPLLPRD